MGLVSNIKKIGAKANQIKAKKVVLPKDDATITEPVAATPKTAQETEFDSRMTSAQGGDAWYEGPMNNTQMGTSLQSNINQQLAGKESNNLLNARMAGSEALARKSGDIRGAAAQNSIMNGQLGQGMAQTGKMGAELATMRGLGDFQSQMSQLAAQEQQQAQANAMQAIGLMQSDDELGETKRQSLVADGLSDDKFRLDLIREAREGQRPGTYGQAMDEFEKEYLSPEGYANAKNENAEFATQEKFMQGVRASLPNMDVDTFDDTMVQQPDGSWQFDGNDLTPAQALEINSQMQNNPEYGFENRVNEKDFENMTETDFSKLNTDIDARDRAGIKDKLTKIGGADAYDKYDYSGGRADAMGDYNAKYTGTIYYDKSSGIYYKLGHASTTKHSNLITDDDFKVHMSGEALNGPNKGKTKNQAWSSSKYDT